MSEQEEERFDKHLVEAYDRMLDHVKEAFTEKGMWRAIDSAAEKTSELMELSREESERVSDYLRRDLHDAAEFIADGSRELGDWLRFDTQVIERGLFDAFSRAVDQTRVELEEFKERNQALAEWHTGEVASIGTLECKACGAHIHFHKTGHIPPCPKCASTHFRRISDSDEE